jgi:hypothetical protein
VGVEPAPAARLDGIAAGSTQPGQPMLPGPNARMLQGLAREDRKPRIRSRASAEPTLSESACSSVPSVSITAKLTLRPSDLVSLAALYVVRIEGLQEQD